MAITEKVKSLVGFLTSGFDREDDIFESIGDELGSDYETEKNLALAPEYSYSSDRNERDKNNLKVVAHPSYRGYEVAVIEPRAFGECAQIVSNLKDNKTIILNLHLLDKEQQQRTIDFVCGASQALNAKPKKVGDTVFVFTPSNVTLSFDQNNEANNISEALWNQP